MRTHLWVIGVLLVLGAARPGAAQTDRATLEGTVLDPTGATIADAEVRILEVQTGITWERAANAAGYYRFPAVAFGEYTVTASKQGFKTKNIQGVELQVGQTRTLDIKLELGAVTEKIDVQAEAVPEELSSAESSAVIRTDQIENIPVNGRNWASLTRLAPWAQDDGGGDQRTIRYAGRARDDNNFSYDGVDATGIQEQAQKSEIRVQISEDAVAEYRVSSALYDAEYGSQAGGQIDIVTKSGTNDFHGSVFGYFRNSIFDARNFTDFDPNGNPVLPPFRMGQYGLTVGGPVVKDKTFFFLSYEGLRQLQVLTLLAAVPDLPVQQAALTNSLNVCPILQAFPWRQSSVSALASFNCAPKFVFPDSEFANSCTQSSNPTCGLAGEFDNFRHQAQGTIIHEDSWLARFDHKFSDKTTLYGRAQRDVAFARAPNGNLFDTVGTYNHPANYLIALQHSFGSNLLNEFKFGLNRAPFHNPQYPGLIDAQVKTPNFEQLNNSQTDNEVGTTFSYVDNLTYTRGRHTLKTGIDVERVRLNQGKTEALAVTFSGDNTSLINNQASQVEYTSSWAGHALRRTFVLPYILDEWKATPTLTVNAGLRWEFYAPVTEAHDRVKIFDLQNCHGFCPPTDPLEYPNYRNFDPRFSVAWAPGALKGKTVIRSGFGIYHGAAQNDDRNAALESDRTDIIFTSTTTTSVPFNPAFLNKPPDFTSIPVTGGFNLVPRALIRHHPDLYAETWGLSVEQTLPAKFSFTISYLGSHGVHLFARNFENLCDPVAFAQSGACNRPLDSFPVTNPDGSMSTFGSVDFKSNVGLSTYNGLLLAVDRHIARGWALNAKYTFSHSINDNSVGGGEANAPQDANCVPCEKGPSIYDVRHNVIVSSYYELPFGPGRQFMQEGVAGRVLGGWTLSGLWNWHTGHPLTVTLNTDPSKWTPDGNDQSTPRPDLAPGVSVVPTGQNANNWINPNAFILPPTDPSTGRMLRYGNEGNGVVRAPNTSQVDLALVKDTKITERFGLEFGAQVFNIFNHTQLADVHTLTLDYSCDSSTPPVCTFAPSSNFGIINTLVNTNNNTDKFAPDNNGTGLARQMQLFVRVKF
jgi:carboxypeptidase family protein